MMNNVQIPNTAVQTSATDAQSKAINSQSTAKAETTNAGDGVQQIVEVVSSLP